jgi:secondary thiamine-phosphate synthase enzyme
MSRAPLDASSTATGSVVIKSGTFPVQTAERVELIDFTDRAAAFVRAAGIRDGVLSLWSMHTTCAVLINEVQSALHADIKQFLETLVARDAPWLHNDPAHSDCDRMNADAHLRAMLLGHSLAVQVAGGELALGQWQRILLAELDGPRERTIRLQAIGVA